MTASTSVWWADKPASELSQGDILAELPAIIFPAPPMVYLKKNTFKGGLEGWVNHPKPDKNVRTESLSLARSVPVIVLNYSCDLDKPKETARVLVAPIGQLKTIAPEQHETILKQKNYALLPLPNVPGLGDCYADLRSITAVDRKYIDINGRLASMTDDSLKRLWAQFVAFFMRKAFPMEWNADTGPTAIGQGE